MARFSSRRALPIAFGFGRACAALSELQIRFQELNTYSRHLTIHFDEASDGAVRKNVLRKPRAGEHWSDRSDITQPADG
jgi:hypothetical protein